MPNRNSVSAEPAFRTGTNYDWLGSGAASAVFAALWADWSGQRGFEGSAEWEAREAAYLEKEHQGMVDAFATKKDLLASNWDWMEQNARQCVARCLSYNYGELYEWANTLSPLTVPSIAAMQFGKLTEDISTPSANRNAWGTRKEQFDIGKRQLKTSGQFGKFNAVMGVVSAGALGFQFGALGYCNVSCVFDE